MSESKDLKLPTYILGLFDGQFAFDERVLSNLIMRLYQTEISDQFIIHNIDR